MEKKKHYNRGQEIALTFPVPKETQEQIAALKELKKQLKIQTKQNKEQAELISQLKEILKKKEG